MTLSSKQEFLIKDGKKGNFIENASTAISSHASPQNRFISPKSSTQNKFRIKKSRESSTQKRISYFKGNPRTIKNNNIMFLNYNLRASSIFDLSPQQKFLNFDTKSKNENMISNKAIQNKLKRRKLSRSMGAKSIQELKDNELQELPKFKKKRNNSIRRKSIKQKNRRSLNQNRTSNLFLSNSQNKNHPIRLKEGKVKNIFIKERERSFKISRK